MIMSEGPRLVTVGMAGATPIQADVKTLGLAVAVTLSSDYAMICPPGFPTRPGFTGVVPAKNYPHSISSGTTLLVLACEAAALIAAGAASYA